MTDKVRKIPVNAKYTLVHAFERLWGKRAYNRLKNLSMNDPRTTAEFRKYAVKTLEASKRTLLENIKIYDQVWMDQALEIIEENSTKVSLAKNFEELSSALFATYIELSFHQFGFNLDRSYVDLNITLKGKDWKLPDFRTVQYVQADEQKENLQSYMKYKEEIRDAGKSTS